MLLVFTLIAIVVALAARFFMGDGGTLAGLSGDQVASLVFVALLGTLVACGIMAGRKRLGAMAKQALAWAAIVIGLVTAYEFRFELQNVASRVSAGLIPGAPIATVNADGARSVTISQNQRHFETSAIVNGESLRFIIDTGASTVVLTHDNARRIGFDMDDLDYVVPVATANGMTRAAPVRLETMEVGGIMRTDLEALVSEQGALFENLLGMSFLDTLSGFEVTGDRLILRD